MEKNLEVLLEKARKYSSTRETSPYDMRQKLLQWGAAADDAESILSVLEKENFIDEARFARAVANDKFRFEKWGKGKIRHFLHRHHVDESAIEEALLAIDEDAYQAVVYHEMTKKNSTIKTGNTWERKSRLFRFAQSRGYETDLSMQIIDRILTE